MKTKKQATQKAGQGVPSVARPQPSVNGRIFSAPDQDAYLDALQLDRLEQAFRDWAEATPRSDVRLSRRRILLIFLLIRYTGAKLSEVLSLHPRRDIDLATQTVVFGRGAGPAGRPRRRVQLSAVLCREIEALLGDLRVSSEAPDLLRVDPGFVRRKFYERAEACGIAKQLGAPEILRQSRAVELLQNHMPLPAVQMMLGHSTPNLTSAYLSFSEDDIQHVTRQFVEKESGRKTSARNTFLGKIQSIQKGDIQTRVEMVTLGGHRVVTVITNDSVERLGLKVGQLTTAEVKAPAVMLHNGGRQPECSADNAFEGIVERVNQGKINTEITVRISDGTEVCAIATRESIRRLAFAEGDGVWVMFSSFAAVLRSD